MFLNGNLFHKTNFQKKCKHFFNMPNGNVLAMTHFYGQYFLFMKTHFLFCIFFELLIYNIKYKILYYVTAITSMIVGLWHLFVSIMLQWYGYLPMQYENLIVGIDYTNYGFSALLYRL